MCYIRCIQISFIQKIVSMYNKKKNELSTAITSAALQDHFLRKANLGMIDFKINQSQKRKAIQKLPSLQKANLQIKKLQNAQKKNILPYQNEKLKKLKQEVQQQEKIFKYNNKLTLAQKLGLIEAPPPPLTNKQWQEIQQKSKNRKDSENVCPICLEGFKIQPQVILSCSHVFHSKCLHSYERHNQIRCCPICRKKDYQKKVIDQAIRLFTLNSILRIQRVFRGSRERIKLYESLVKNGYAPKSKLFNRRMIGYKMWSLSKKISDKVKNNKKMFEEILHNMQKKHIQDTEDILQEMVIVQRNKIKNQNDIQKYLNALGITQEKKAQKIIDWEEIKEKGISRVQDQCAICLMSLWTKPVYLLSCSHLFHVNCIEGLQRYAIQNNKTSCPCCRSTYQKKLVQVKKNK